MPDHTDNCPFICTTGVCKNPIVIGDTGYTYELDTTSLNCLSRHDPVKDFGLHSLSSHPMVDEETGETWNIGISILGISGAKWNVIKFPPGCNSSSVKDSIKKAQIVSTYPCRNKASLSWLHSFGMTKKYVKQFHYF
jgi:carotenoid cleavage dioxygenase-like enzyme